jgi:thymidylate kinase
MLIMLDGIDGSGKSTILDAWKKEISAQGNGIFDLKNYWQETGRYPELSEMRAYDFIFSCEPTYAGMGKIIREELVSAQNDYPPEAIAHGFSLDRLILYKKIIIPLLRRGKFIIQDRGVSSSLAYQSLQSDNLTLEILASLPGNALALENRPDYLVLAELTAEEAMERLGARSGKQDNAIFERLDFLKRLEGQYRDEKFRNLFIDRGAKITELPTNVNIDTMKEQAVILLRRLLQNKN